MIYYVESSERSAFQQNSLSITQLQNRPYTEETPVHMKLSSETLSQSREAANVHRHGPENVVLECGLDRLTRQVAAVHAAGARELLYRSCRYYLVKNLECILQKPRP